MHTLSEILVCVLYRTFESHGGWKIENRLVRGLVHHNLLYFGCSFGLYSNHSQMYIYFLNRPAFSLSVILASIFLPVSHCDTQSCPLTQVVFGDAHDCRVRLILLGGSDSCSFSSRTQVVVLSLMVTRMHRDFWRSDRVSCGNDEVDLTLSTFMAATPDVV